MTGSRLIITCMRNEGPFILEWIAYHRSIGFDDFLVFTNDCDDGTVELLEALQDHGVLTTMDNPYQRIEGGMNPQKGALFYANDTEQVARAEWIMVSDVDEFVNIHAGDGTLDALWQAVDADVDNISMQWRLFGNADVDGYCDEWVTDQFDRCAPTFCPSPVQAWAVKTLLRTTGGKFPCGRYKRLGVHRPIDPGAGATEKTNWVDGSGRPVLRKFRENGWRFGTHSHGYGLVTLNHYAVRSADSFLVKRDRGRVNHVERDQGLAYWLRMNFNMERDTSIRRHLPRAKAERDRLLALGDVKARHTDAVEAHRAKIRDLKTRDDMAAFHAEITSDRMKLISRHLNLLSRDQFNAGPDAIGPEIFERIERVPELLAE
ncbi:glycosyltransferase family 2 protein [Psychromarinibacter halotolerans]|uniref:Glycosyltransferase family 2 protein n=1 Tax=Psychromarinibacter halotolerans TaxID=1775175 RepID=A0ABV7GPP6_9RHOB|nr:glycosyltransferase family 2 protein [Psychromarinibacter halotolerans]MDF0594653.1 glycosyltransferase family 2 protein [Psychromarinibacter halotolerans]